MSRVLALLFTARTLKDETHLSVQLFHISLQHFLSQFASPSHKVSEYRVAPLYLTRKPSNQVSASIKTVQTKYCFHRAWDCAWDRTPDPPLLPNHPRIIALPQPQPAKNESPIPTFQGENEFPQTGPSIPGTYSRSPQNSHQTPEEKKASGKTSALRRRVVITTTTTGSAQ